VTRVALAVLCALLTGCGSSAETQKPPPPAGPPRLTFAYERSAPLEYTDRGLVSPRGEPIAIHDVSYRSGGDRIEAYLLVPPGRGRRPAVVFVHGAGADRSELIERAAWLAARNVVTMTISEPSVSNPPPRVAGGPIANLKQVRVAQTRDVVAVRRAVDVLQSLPQVNPRRIGYLGWSAGARSGTLVAASEPRIRALVLLSAGAAPIAAYVSAAPPGFRTAVRQVLGSLDPIRYVGFARPGSVLLEDGTRDEIVPAEALKNIIDAAPRGTTVRWYDAPHALNRAAYHDAYDWLARRLPIDGPRVRGAPTETSVP